MSERKRLRSVPFTLNNYTVEEVAHIKAQADAGSFKYIVFQEEVGGLTGTPHLQGFAQRKNPTDWNTWKRLLGERCHFVPDQRGTAQQNRDYCTKDVNKDGSVARIPGTLIYEKGEIPVQGERNDLTAIVEAAKDPANTLRDIIEVDGIGFLKHFKGVQFIRQQYVEPRRHKTRIFWFYGPTGLGKSHWMQELCPRGYWKQNSQWWCGYEPSEHPDVIIDDYRLDFCKFSELLRLFDKYPLTVQNKGGNIIFNARRIFISSPKSPQDAWVNRTEEDLQQLLRRIEVIVEFTPSPLRDDGRIVANKVFHKGLLSDCTVDDSSGGDQQSSEAVAEAAAIVDSDETQRRTRGRFVVEADEPPEIGRFVPLDEPPPGLLEHLRTRYSQDEYNFTTTAFR